MGSSERKLKKVLRRQSILLIASLVSFTLFTDTSAMAQAPAEDLVLDYESSVPNVGSYGRAPDRNGLQSVGSVSVSVEAIFGNINDSSALIGSPNAPQIFGERFYAASLDALDGSHVGISELQPALVGQQLSNDSTIGTRIRVNYRGENESGLEVSGFWLGDATRSWQRGLGGFDSGDDPTNVRVTAALPLDDGAGGYAVPYDQYFHIGLTTDVCGLGADYAPVGAYWGGVLIQPTIGARYFDLNEQFGFAAADSGLQFVHLPNGLPDETTLFPPNPAFPPYQSVLDVTADNQLLGPCVGLNFTTSGKIVRFSSNSRVGGLFVDTQQTLSGQGFGNGFAPGFDPSIAFSDSRSQTYSTAFLEQSLNMDFELFRLLPKFAPHQRENSLALRVGWSLLAIDSVARPVESVEWNGFPLAPTITENRSDFILQTWNVGLLFQY